MSDRKLRCAIYTRKSSEEGLEQDFNSLHAQREACEAYVLSQKHEGWSPLKASYDDGGFSGGSMERPGLKRLLADITDGKVDVVVVYKVDRLTRSLADFAKIVDIFDHNKVSFVSVTQAFNTTSSMGRLTLNVLLSFAQFEREVTGERIRDKIAASKKKGMWMGGNTPLGYKADKRSLVVVDEHAAFVCHLYERYLALGSVELLQRELHDAKITTPIRLTEQGNQLGGANLSRGALYHLLQNPIYRGKIRHKNVLHDGLHEPIIAAELWDEVQQHLADNRHRERGSARAKHPSLLAGLLSFEDGRRLIASHAVKNGVRYRYYRSTPDEVGAPRRAALSFAAETLEAAVTTALTRHLNDPTALLAQALTGTDPAVTVETGRSLARRLAGDPASCRAALLEIVEHVEISPDSLGISLRTLVGQRDGKEAGHILRESINLVRRGNELRILVPAAGPPEPKPDPALLKALGQAHRWWRDLSSGRYKTLREIAAVYETDERYAAHVLRLAFLSPDLTRQIVAGTQPLDLTLSQLLWKIDLPASWDDQANLIAPARARAPRLRSGATY